MNKSPVLEVPILKIPIFFGWSKAPSAPELWADCNHLADFAQRTAGPGPRWCEKTLVV